MKDHRNHVRHYVSLALALIAFIGAVAARHAAAQATASWIYTGSLNTARESYTATLMPNGKVLVTGGSDPTGYNPFNSTELYNPATGTWSYTGNLTKGRYRHTATLLPNGKVLVAGGVGDCTPNGGCRDLRSAELYDPATGTWSITSNLNAFYSEHTATLLQNGKVLVAQSSAELYDPTTGTWSYTGGLNTLRVGHNATLLTSGKVLVTGGKDNFNLDGDPLNSAELYDPNTGTWTTTGSLKQGRAFHTATLLPNGKVLIVGGDGAELYDPIIGTWSSIGNPASGMRAVLLPSGKVLVAGGGNNGDGKSAELYDPAAGTWSHTPSLNIGYPLTATLLLDGRVLVTELSAAAELYDPGTDSTPTPASGPTWTITGNLNSGRDYQTATLLPNGKVLVAGGNNSNGTLKSAELYDPANGTWSITGNLNTSRAFYTATLLPNGKVLVAGGFTCGPPPQICADVSSAELYDPATGTWISTGSLNAARSSQTATLLSSGKVMVAGGLLANSELNTAELYDPATGTWSITGNLNVARLDHTSTLLPNGNVIVAGGANSDGRLNSAELYDPAAGTWSITGTLNSTRELHTATLLPNGKVLVAAGFISFDTGATTNSAELYDPATGQWSKTGNLNTERAYHTATLLGGGKVLVAGGFNITGGFPNILNSAELYDPATGAWSNTANLNVGRRFYTTTLLLNGKVLAAGGSGPDASNSAELYDPGPNPIDDPQFFVRQHYHDFLNREADSDGLNFWVGEILQCGSDPQCIEVKRINDSASFFLSIEFQETGYLVYRIYKASYGNLPNAPVPIKFDEFLPDTQEIGKNVIVRQAGWEQTLENNKQLFAAAFVQRQRFVSAYPTSLTPDVFVDALFTNAGVTPSGTDRSAAIAEFGAAANTADIAARARALRRIAENSTLAQQEFNRAFVLMQYFGYLRRNPNDAPDGNFAGYDFWLNKLNQFNGDFVQAEMVKAFLSSSEYRRRFGP